MLKLTLIAAIVATLGALVSPAYGASTPALPTIPGAPTLPTPKPDAIARFKMTISGFQEDKSDFFHAPEADGCSNRIEGKYSEVWNWERGKEVTMVFRRYGHRIYLQRAGRQFADTAFGTQGTLHPEASGFQDIRTGGISCVSYPLADPKCGQTVKAPLDLRLDWSKGVLRLRESGPAAAVPNPGLPCGLTPNGHASINQLSNSFPFMNKQKGRLTARQIFKSKRSYEIKMKDTFIGSLNPEGYERFNEELEGESEITLERL